MNLSRRDARSHAAADVQFGAGSPRRALRFAFGGAVIAAALLAGGFAVMAALGAWEQRTAPRAPSPAPAASAPDSDSSEPPTALPNGVALDPAWLDRVSADAGIPQRALRAYASAAVTLTAEQPGCHLGWNMLAGIGKVESEHGSINGSRLLATGETAPRIVGVPLDGTRFLATPDTDGGAIDGDAEWDRAVGPMQFIPETWAMFGRDGNRDGRIEIDQIDDAALSAAALLCDPGLDLTVGEHWIAALDGYNPSASYNNDVAEAAEFYAQFG